MTAGTIPAPSKVWVFFAQCIFVPLRTPHVKGSPQVQLRTTSGKTVKSYTLGCLKDISGKMQIGRSGLLHALIGGKATSVRVLPLFRAKN